MPDNHALESQLSQWKIYQGPRNKRLATRHLEYLMYALMDGVTKPIFNASKGTITLNGFLFDLAKLLNAQPDFEQMSLDDLQMSVYCTKNGKIMTGSSTDTLHPLEKKALKTWFSGAYSLMNNLLRNQQITSNSYELLLTITLAVQGLKKLEDSKAKELFRNEQAAPFIEERERLSEQKKIICQKGFTAVSLIKMSSFGQIKTRYSDFNQGTVVAKNISMISFNPYEQECLFSPYTEFIFLKDVSHHWQAFPVRSINYENRHPYQHGFTQVQLKQIANNTEKCRLNAAAFYLQIHHAILDDSINEVIRLLAEIDCNKPSSLQQIFSIIQLLQIRLDSMDENLTKLECKKLEVVQDFLHQVLTELQILHRPPPKPLTLFSKHKLNEAEKDAGPLKKEEEQASQRQRLK